MKNVFLGCLATLLASVTCPTGYGQITADDFMPVIQGGSAEVQEPSKVKVDGETVSAPTAQDAINAAVDENRKDLANGNPNGVGCKIVKFESGLGFVATGMASYRNMDNPVATRISKRKAYVVAFAEAKKNLAEKLGGLNNTGKTEVRKSLLNVNLPNSELTNISEDTVEAISQSLDMMLRGFVIYEVDDNPETSLVTVSIVTTPKTRGQLARPAPGVVEVETLRDGIEQVLAEVRTGVVPPVGGRIIMVRSTGETAFVGFGSAIVRTNSDPAVQAKLSLAAQKVAKARASDSLCGVIVGDRTSWQGTFEDESSDAYQEMQEFKEATRDDPLAEASISENKKLDQAYNNFVSKIRTNEVFLSARSGVLPPGVTTNTWFDEENAWAFGMSVYIPSVTNAAAATADEMKNGQIIQGINSAGGAEKQANDPKVNRPGEEVKRGPSGKVSDDKDN
jgi:hypothetical protein